MIPSPNVTNNHQEKNARILEEHGAAVVILEQDCTGEKLYETVQNLLRDREKQKSMSASVRQMVVLDSAERICDILETLAAGRKR